VFTEDGLDYRSNPISDYNNDNNNTELMSTLEDSIILSRDYPNRPISKTSIAMPSVGVVPTG
jgi:hypothetical protein